MFHFVPMPPQHHSMVASYQFQLGMHSYLLLIYSVMHLTSSLRAIPCTTIFFLPSHEHSGASCSITVMQEVGLGESDSSSRKLCALAACDATIQYSFHHLLLQLVLILFDSYCLFLLISPSLAIYNMYSALFDITCSFNLHVDLRLLGNGKIIICISLCHIPPPHSTYNNHLLHSVYSLPSSF